MMPIKTQIQADVSRGGRVCIRLGVGVLAAAAGAAVRSRGLMAAELEARTGELRVAREEQARLKVAGDRARLSAELDVLLQRRLDELGRLADFGARSSDPAVATAKLVDIENESRRTLEQVRGLVGVLRERERAAAELAERARERGGEHETHAQLSARYGGARIASELHDIVAHAISVMVVQAGSGQRLVARDPELTAGTFEAIAGAAHQARQDIGRLVAVLVDEDPAGPAPDLALIEELVGRACGNGHQVTLRLAGEREKLPAPLVAVAYVVVREGLTNALRYASGAAVAVLLLGEPEALVVEVENALAAGDAALAGVGTGNGLTGLRERARALGGTLEAGSTLEGGWRLRARLPRPDAIGTSLRLRPAPWRAAPPAWTPPSARRRLATLAGVN